jgi:ATP-binding cassette, subfamily B, bacterial PglK
MKLLQKFDFLLTLSQKRQLIFLFFLLIVSIVFELLGIGVMLPAFSFLFNNNLTEENPLLSKIIILFGSPSQNSLVLMGMLSIVIIYLFKGIFLLFTTWKQSDFVSKISYGISSRLYHSYLSQPYQFFVNRNSSDLLRNIQMEVHQFQSVILAVVILFSELAVIISIVIFLVFLEPIGAISISLFLTFFILLFHQISKTKLLKWGEKRQYYDSKIGLTLLQSLAAIKDLKILNREDFFLQNFDLNNSERLKLNTKQLTLQNIPRLYLEFVSVLGLAGLVFVLIYMGNSLGSVLPKLTVFAAGAFRIIPSANRIMGSIQNIRFAEPVVTLLHNELNLSGNNKINYLINSNSKFRFKSDIIFENICFTYPSKNVKALKDFSFKIRRGQTIGIVGQSGSGKSTLADIILGLFNPDSGKILVDGFDIKNSLNEWQNLIGYVPQTIYLIDDSLKNNIALGVNEHDINEELILKSIVSSQLLEFVSSLPDGLNTNVGDRGVKLSGGQRQRIGIARALYNNPDILILDEATSALDSLTEDGVMDSIYELNGERTILIIAHRLSTLKHCDKIIELRNGKILKIGIPTDFIKA